MAALVAPRLSAYAEVMAHADDERYLAMLEKLRTREPLDETTWLYHFEHQNLDASSGIEVGATAPDFTLVDDAGVARSRAILSGRNGLLAVFARSADW